MTLLAAVVEILEEQRTPCAVIGAAALAALGTSRATVDLDLLTTDRRVLIQEFWTGIVKLGAVVDIRIGDDDDPLVGVVRVTQAQERPVDIIVGGGHWQDQILSEAQPRSISNAVVPVVDLIGFVLLKLYAGGPQDLWDIEQVLFTVEDRKEIETVISRRLSDLPHRCRVLWDRMNTFTA